MLSLKYSHRLQEPYIKQHTNLLLEGHKLTPFLVHRPMRSHLLQQLWVQARQLEKTIQIINFCSQNSVALTSGNFKCLNSKVFSSSSLWLSCCSDWYLRQIWLWYLSSEIWKKRGGKYQIYKKKKKKHNPDTQQIHSDVQVPCSWVSTMSGALLSIY